jgi:protein-disulfide isomerase
MSQTTPSLPKRRVPIWVLLLIVAVIVVAAGIVVYLLMPLNGPIPDGVETHYVGLEQGFTEAGFPRLGSPTAPVLVEDFSSYACPHCRTFHEEQFEDLLPAIAAGEVQFVMIPIPNIGPGARTAAAGALCAGEQGKFWEMHDTLFDWQRRFVASIFHERRVKKGAENLGLDTAAFGACLDSDRIATIIDRARQEFDRRGLSGTPSIFINGQRVRDYRELENLSRPESTGV